MSVCNRMPDEKGDDMVIIYWGTFYKRNIVFKLIVCFFLTLQRNSAYTRLFHTVAMKCSPIMGHVYEYLHTVSRAWYNATYIDACILYRIITSRLATLNGQTERCTVYINKPWPGYAIWLKSSGLALVKIMDCCLISSSYYLDHCWTIGQQWSR